MCGIVVVVFTISFSPYFSALCSHIHLLLSVFVKPELLRGWRHLQAVKFFHFPQVTDLSHWYVLSDDSVQFSTVLNISMVLGTFHLSLQRYNEPKWPRPKCVNIQLIRIFGEGTFHKVRWNKWCGSFLCHQQESNVLQTIIYLLLQECLLLQHSCDTWVNSGILFVLKTTLNRLSFMSLHGHFAYLEAVRSVVWRTEKQSLWTLILATFQDTTVFFNSCIHLQTAGVQASL